jgi:hypothetical protein
MKRIIYISVALLLTYLLFPKSYTSFPGHVTKEMYEAFEQTKAQCFGYSHLTNAEQAAADAPGKSLCFGLLIR